VEVFNAASTWYYYYYYYYYSSSSSESQASSSFFSNITIRKTVASGLQRDIQSLSRRAGTHHCATQL
jgi:hypothetical protein